jgi:SAM-dependent methyltransferase
MATESPYDRNFFAGQKSGSYIAASVITPHVLSLCEATSVADFGCGVGTWLHAVYDLGIRDIKGVDGDYVHDEDLEIPKEAFVRADLRSPIDLGRTFDLVMSLEVAEHLSTEAASVFVSTLTRHAPVVLFSAAVPLQGGTDHINEQWPQFWISLFEERGFACIDCLRDLFWDDERIAWWYRQNMLLFVKADRLHSYPRLVREVTRVRKFPLALVHPGFMAKSAKEHLSPRWLMDQLSIALRASAKRRMKWLPL